MTLIEAYVSALLAMRNVEKAGNIDWMKRHRERIAQLNDKLPHGREV